MTTQRNVERVNVKYLTEAAIQRCFFKKIFFKESRILKTTCVYIHFLKKLQAFLAKNNSFRIFFQEFCSACFEISEYFKNIYFAEHVSVNVYE